MKKEIQQSTKKHQFFYAFDRGQAYIYCLSHSRGLNIYLWKLFPNLSLRANCATIKLIVLSDRSISEIYTEKKNSLRDHLKQIYLRSVKKATKGI